MVSLPTFLTEQTEQTIRQRILAALPSDYDKSEGSVLWDLVAAIAIELARSADWAQQLLERGFAQTTFGTYLKLRAEEHGVIQKEAARATGAVTFTGAPGTPIPALSRVSTGSSAAQAAEVFTTDTAATIPAGGAVTVPVTAEAAGARGNVAVATITFQAAPIPGVSGLANGAPTAGGADTENDPSLLSRYLTRVRNPSAGGNKADYVNWVLEVAGVGGVAVAPVRDGPGTVAVAVIGSDKGPAGPAVVDAVQNYIAPPWTDTREAETMTLGGSGAAVDGTAAKLSYNAAGVATATDTALHSILQQPGIWEARASVRVDANAGAAVLLEIGVWNVTAGAWAKTSASSAADARVVKKGSELGLVFGNVVVSYYWNGTDQLELRITRQQADTATVVWVDKVVYRSTFSRDTGDGLAPIGARVTVEPATAISISVSATLSIAPGYDGAGVRAAVEANIDAYLKGLAFQGDNDVRFVRIGEAILDTPGVLDYTGLLMNGGTANLAIADQQVAVKGTVLFT